MFTKENLPGQVLRNTLSQLRAMWGQPVIDKRMSLGGCKYDKEMVCLMCLQYPQLLLLDPTKRRKTSCMPDPVGLSIKQTISKGNLKAGDQVLLTNSKKVAASSSVYNQITSAPAQAINGKESQPRKECFRSNVEYQPWWEVDLGNPTVINKIHISAPLTGKDGMMPQMKFIVFLSTKPLQLTAKDKREGVMEIDMAQRDSEAYHLVIIYSYSMSNLFFS
jgi:hypothetical protein